MARQKTLYQQLYESFKRRLKSGSLPPGSRIPSTRELAQESGVSRNVVLSVYEQLIAEGYLEAHTGKGTFVSQHIPSSTNKEQPARESPEVTPVLLSPKAQRASEIYELENRSTMVRTLPIDFRYGIVNFDLRSHHQWRRLHQANNSRYRNAYFPSAGLDCLRSALASYLVRRRGMPVTEDDILLTSGAHQGINLIAEALINAGDGVYMEEPGYPGARNIFQYHGASLFPLAVDASGVDTDAIRTTSDAPRLLYVTPSHQFPVGSVLTMQRRVALLNWARDRNGYLIEDDYDSEFRYSGRALESLWTLDRHQRVIYVGTFSKSLFPSLRLGFVIAPAALLEKMALIKAITDPGNAAINQATLADFIERGYYELHLRRRSRHYSLLRDTMLGALNNAFSEEIEISGADAGLHILAKFVHLNSAETDALIGACEADGVGIYSAQPYFHDRRTTSSILLGFGILEPDDIRSGVDIIARHYRSIRRNKLH